MDRIGTPSVQSAEARRASALLSPQVSEARTFFLNLGGGRAEPIVLVLGGRERCNPDYALVRSRFPYFVIEYVVSPRGCAGAGFRRAAPDRSPSSGGLVKEAASRVGFADPYHFSRCFKAVHGAPPSRLSGLRR